MGKSSITRRAILAAAASGAGVATIPTITKGKANDLVVEYYARVLQARKEGEEADEQEEAKGNRMAFNCPVSRTALDRENHFIRLLCETRASSIAGVHAQIEHFAWASIAFALSPDEDEYAILLPNILASLETLAGDSL